MRAYKDLCFLEFYAVEGLDLDNVYNFDRRFRMMRVHDGLRVNNDEYNYLKNLRNKYVGS